VTKTENEERDIMRGLIGAAVLALALTGCGGTGEATSPTTTSTTTTAPARLTAADIAHAAGCQGYAADSEVALFAEQNGPCEIGGNEIYVTTFHDNTLRDQWLEMARMAGGVFGVGDRWTITGDDFATVEQAVSAAGGQMK
jgi:hypothetical protein